MKNSVLAFCVLPRLTVVTEAVSAAGDDHGVAQQLVADQAEQLVWNGLLLDDGRRLLRGKGRLLLLAHRVRVAAAEECVHTVGRPVFDFQDARGVFQKE